MELTEIVAAAVIIVGAILTIVKAVTKATPGKKDDEVVGKIERIVRPILNVLRPRFTQAQLDKAEDIREFNRDGSPRVRYGTGEDIDPNRVREGEIKRPASDE